MGAPGRGSRFIKARYREGCKILASDLPRFAIYGTPVAKCDDRKANDASLSAILHGDLTAQDVGITTRYGTSTVRTVNAVA